MVKRLFRKFCNKNAFVGLTQDGFLVVNNNFVIRTDLLDKVKIDYLKYSVFDVNLKKRWQELFDGGAVVYDVAFNNVKENTSYNIPIYEFSIDGKLFKINKIHIDFVEKLLEKTKQISSRKIFCKDNYYAIAWVDDSGILAVSTGFKD
jgi:hypothetical protein